MRGYNITMKKIILAASAALALVLGFATPAQAAEPTHLPSPTVVDECGTENDRIELPEVEGAYYGWYDYSGTVTKPSWDEYGWEPGDELLVIAGPADWGTWTTPPTVDEGVYVDAYGNAGWWFPGFTDVPCLTEVTPVRPKWSDPAGAGNATWIYQDTEAYHYVIDYPANGRIRVTAYANPGYVFADGVQTRWGRLEANL